MKFACTSVAAMDYFPRHDTYCPGGNALNQALVLSHLGYKTSFLGALGTDEAGRKIMRLLENQRVDISHAKILEGSSASNRLYNDEDGERFGEEGAWKNGVYPDYVLDTAAKSFLLTHQVWSTHANSPVFELLLSLKKPQHRLVVDFMHEYDPDIMESYINYVDIAYVGGSPDMAPAMAMLAVRYPEKLLVLTLGALGAMAWKGSLSWKQKAVPVKKVIDTTGCGDAFQAACSARYLNGGNVEEALTAGVQASSICCQHLGAVSWIVSRLQGDS